MPITDHVATAPCTDDCVQAQRLIFKAKLVKGKSGFAQKVRKTSLEEVSTTCGSGWVSLSIQNQ
jgi:hypothetical protein